MFLCVLLSYPGQSSSLDHVNSGYIRDERFTVIYKLATLKIYSGAKPNKVQHSPPQEHFQHQSKSIAYCFSCKVTLPI